MYLFVVTGCISAVCLTSSLVFIFLISGNTCTQKGPIQVSTASTFSITREQSSAEEAPALEPLRYARQLSSLCMGSTEECLAESPAFGHISKNQIMHFQLFTYHSQIWLHSLCSVMSGFSPAFFFLSFISHFLSYLFP